LLHNWHLQVEDAGFKLWMAGQQQHISFDPLAAQVTGTSKK
jgi:hypothetical protein